MHEKGKQNDETMWISVTNPPEKNLTYVEKNMGLCVKPLYGGLR